MLTELQGVMDIEMEREFRGNHHELITNPGSNNWQGPQTGGLSLRSGLRGASLWELNPQYMNPGGHTYILGIVLWGWLSPAGVAVEV